MRRGFIGCVALLLALGVVIQPAEARDRKSAATRDRDGVFDTRVTREVRAFAVRQEVFIASATIAGAAAADRPAAKRSGNFIARLADPEPPRTNRLNSSSALSLFSLLSTESKARNSRLASSVQSGSD